MNNDKEHKHEQKTTILRQAQDKDYAAIVVGVVIIIAVGGLLLSCGGDETQDKTFTIGLVNEVEVHSPAVEGFKAGMTDLGYVEGEDIVYVYNGTTPDTQAIDDAIQSMLDQDVDLIFTAGGLPPRRAKQAVEGTGVPVVFGAVSDPVGLGIVDSIARPNGNLTGVQVGLEIPKALEWLVTITPGASKIYVPYNPDDIASTATLATMEQIPSQLGIELVLGEVHSVEEAVAAIENLPEDIDAIFRIPAPTLDPRNDELSQAAIRRGLPMGSCLPLDEAVLITLASGLFEVGKQTARIAHQVLQGDEPAVLPVETSEFFMTINLKTAEAIGLDVPENILRQADTIVR
jgi:putative ABC transport system substrate-binding protein